MGILNYMIFSMSQRRALRVNDEDFQYLVPHVDWSQTRRDFPVRAGRPVSPAGKPMVLHYAGDKPYIFNDVYTSPMRVFRVNAKLRLFPHWSRPRALASVLGEDLSAHARFRKKIGSWLATRIAATTLLKKATRRFRAE